MTMAPKRGRGIWRGIRLVCLAVILLLLVPFGLTLLYGAVSPVSTVMLWRRVTGHPVQRFWVSLDQVSPALIRAVIVAEDARYCSHLGVDFRGVAEAIEETDDLRRARGGSSITQQTVKNLFLWPSRSVVRKVIEAPLALWFDLVLGKRRVLEIYLNVAEWGPNGQFGIEAGARRAFGKSAAALDAREASLLAAVLPNPHTRDARRPGPGLLRLAGIYQRRAAAWTDLAACVMR
jgi:monofunctional biosynthetic peptidoglycan transglycosylase